MKPFTNYIITLSLFISFTGLCQSFDPDEIIRKITLTKNDTSTTFNIKVVTKPQKIENNKLYYWYSNEMIFKNMGGYSGNLLHGEYIIRINNYRMIEKGYFNNGLKNGEWKSWYDNGVLKRIENWDNGLKNGKSYFYNINGKLSKTMDYKDNLVDGYITNFYSNDTIYQKYEKGRLVFDSKKTTTSKTKKKRETSFLKKVSGFFKNIFTKFKKEEKEKEKKNDIKDKQKNKSEDRDITNEKRRTKNAP